MGTYVLLTKVAAERMGTVEKLHELDETVRAKVTEHCPSVKWLASYALLGPYDYMDILDAPDDGTANEVALIVRSFGYATTETWTAVPRDRLKRSAGRGSDTSRAAEPGVKAVARER
jgi:uncharacterized protein with GYD domain